MLLQEERESLDSFRKKILNGENLSKEDLLKVCEHFEETIEIASVSIKIVERLRSNYANLSKKLE